MRAPIANPWGSPRGLSVQTVDVYVDTDPRAEGGARLLLPGRNAAFYVADVDGALKERQPSFDLVMFPATVNRTCILDVAWPEGGVQEEMLSGYPAATGSIDGLTADDFGRIPLLTGH